MTLHDQIINEFREKFSKKGTIENGARVSYPYFENTAMAMEIESFLLSALTRVREDERKQTLFEVYKDMRTILPIQLPPHADYVAVRRVALDSLQDELN